MSLGRGHVAREGAVLDERRRRSPRPTWGSRSRSSSAARSAMRPIRTDPRPPSRPSASSSPRTTRRPRSAGASMTCSTRRTATRHSRWSSPLTARPTRRTRSSRHTPTGACVLARPAAGRQGRRPDRGRRRVARRDPGLHRCQHACSPPGAVTAPSSRRSPTPRWAASPATSATVDGIGEDGTAVGERGLLGPRPAPEGGREPGRQRRVGDRGDLRDPPDAVPAGRRAASRTTSSPRSRSSTRAGDSSSPSDAVAYEPPAPLRRRRVRAQGPDHDPRPARDPADART